LTGSQAIADQRVSNGSGDGDDAAGALPEEKASEWEGYSSSYYNRTAGKPAGQARQSQRVSVVSVEKGTRLELPENWGNDPGIEARTPDCRDDSDSGARQTAGQLTPRCSDNDLVQSSAVQLASEQPHLPLAAAPLSARGDVNDWRDQVPGSMASEPLSRATSASSVRSSDRLNGLWR
jgi:hypothetical protein